MSAGVSEQIIMPIEEAQIPSLAQLAPQFIEEFYGWRSSVDVPRMEAMWRGLYANGNGIAFGLYEEDRLVGAIGGMNFQDMFDGVRTVADLGWFVQRASRRGLKPVLLLRMLERWAKEQEARRMTFTKLIDPSRPIDPQLPDCRRLGYYPRSVTFGKHLTEVNDHV